MWIDTQRRFPWKHGPASALLRPGDAGRDRSHLDPGFEVPDTSIKSTTHLVWLDATEFIASVGEQLWKLT